MGVLGKSMDDSLPDPPDSIGNKFNLARRVIPVGRFYQPQISFIDQVK